MFFWLVNIYVCKFEDIKKKINWCENFLKCSYVKEFRFLFLGVFSVKEYKV